MELLNLLSAIDGKVLLVAVTGYALYVGRLIATSPEARDDA